MAHRSTDAFLLLHVLRIRGRGAAADLVTATALPETAVAETLERLAGEGLAEPSADGVWKLTAAGSAEQASRLAEERRAADADHVLHDAYFRFCDLDGELKSICADWQLRTVDGTQELNDHSDADYDAAVLSRFAPLHAELRPILAELTDAFDRFTAYGTRFDHAAARISAGDGDWVAKPTIDSFHTVWFELHEDLLVSTGRPRQT